MRSRVLAPGIFIMQMSACVLLTLLPSYLFPLAELKRTEAASGWQDTYGTLTESARSTSTTSTTTEI